MDSPPQKPITRKDKVLTIVSVITDALIIGLLVYTLMVNSCQICYQTTAGQNTFKQCKGMSDVLETGLPSEVIDVYEGNAVTKNNLTVLPINAT